MLSDTLTARVAAEGHRWGFSWTRDRDGASDKSTHTLAT